MGSIHGTSNKAKERIRPNLFVVSLDNSIKHLNVQDKYHSMINEIESFEDLHQCKKYIKSVSIKDQILFLVNDQFGEKTIERIHQYRQIISIYIHNTNQIQNQQWILKLNKIKSISNDFNVLLDKIHFEYRRRKRQMDESIPIGIFKGKTGEGESTSELNGNFIHSELSIDVLLRMKSHPDQQNEFIKFSREKYADNPKELEMIDEFTKEYRSDRALWWYTRETFLYRLLNQALRLKDLDLLFRFAFFIRDIEQQLCEHQYPSPIRLYRGQIISNEEFKFLQNSLKEYFSMNSFLSTSVDEKQARSFLDGQSSSSNVQSVLFVIDADPTIEGIKPFADISPFSFFVDEQEILIMLGAIFQLIDIRRDRHIWIVQLRLCGNDHHPSKSILEHMKKDYGGDQTQTDLLSFGSVIANMGHFDQAQIYFHRLLDELPPDHHGIAHCYHNLGQIALEKEDYQSSLQFFQKSIQMKVKRSQTDHSDLAETYNSIGIVHRKMGDYTMALQSYNQALNIFQQTANQIEIAKCFNNIGNIYQLQKCYVDALHYYQKALQIQENHLPKDHPDLGSLYSNIAGVYQCLADHHRALEQYQMSLTIFERSLPPQHPAIAMTLKNMAVVYKDIGDLHQALNYLRKAASIRRQTLPSTHLQLQLIEQDIQRISLQLKSFS